MRGLLRCVAMLLGVALAGSVARAQVPVYAAPPRNPYAYPGPANPIRGAQPFTGSSYGFQPPGSNPTSCYPPATSYYPSPTGFYDPHIVNAPYPTPGPYWYTRHYPFTNGYYSYYYTPGYFRY